MNERGYSDFVKEVYYSTIHFCLSFNALKLFFWNSALASFVSLWESLFDGYNTLNPTCHDNVELMQFDEEELKNFWIFWNARRRLWTWNKIKTIIHFQHNIERGAFNLPLCTLNHLCLKKRSVSFWITDCPKKIFRLSQFKNCALSILVLHCRFINLVMVLYE